LQIVVKIAIAFIPTLSTFLGRNPLKLLKPLTQALADLLHLVAVDADDPGYIQTISVLLL
jgi:hypothetical protein